MYFLPRIKNANDKNNNSGKSSFLLIKLSKKTLFDWIIFILI